MPRPRLGEERGSLPLALLTMLLVGSVISVTTATVITGQEQTRFDQGFEQSLPIAEVGLDRMVSLVESRARTQSFYMPLTTVGGGSYQGQAVLDPSTTTWTIASTGRAANGTQRTLQVKVSQRGVFTVAAFGRDFSDFNGGNGADSYRSGTWSGGTFTRLPNAGLVCGAAICAARQTGNGIISTNGRLKLKGQTFDTTDGAEIHFARERVPSALPGATGYCEGVPSVCSGYNQVRDASRPLADGNRKLEYFRDPIELPPVSLPGSPTGAFDGAGKTVAPGTYIYTNATLYSTTTFTGTPANPVVIYLTGSLKVPSSQDVNFDAFGGTVGPRPSSSLLIYSSAAAGNAFDFGSSARVSAALYGPSGSFAGGSQGHMFGSMAVANINNTGGWTFHYDEALGIVTTGGAPQASSWVEVR